MSGNIIGERFVVISFGESHGPCVGAIVEGCPAGLPIREDEVQHELDLRRPGTSSITTTRSEEDKVEILSGIYKGYTTGAPIGLLVRNKDVDSAPYDAIRKTPRPGHADYTSLVKYDGFADSRGGGRSSGRVTVSFVLAGAVAKKLIKHCLGVEVVAYATAIGGVKAPPTSFTDSKKIRYTNEVRCPHTETAELMKQKILDARKRGDSVGGVVECVAINLPVGVGEPVFDNLDSELSKAIFSIPGVKGVEFGAGFTSTEWTGLENNDPFAVKEGHIITTTNNAGGVLGGVSSGMPVTLRVAFKPPASIALLQKTVNVDTLESVDIAVPGRHDPCIVPRAVPVVEGVVSMVLADLCVRGGFIPTVLKPSD